MSELFNVSQIAPASREHCFWSIASRVRTLVNYGLAGIVGTVFHYVLMFSLLGVTAPLLASSFGALLGCVTNFAICRAFVFTTERSLFDAFLRFLTVGLLCILLNGLVFSVAFALLPVLPSQILATIAVLLAGFVMNQRWTFGA